MKVKTGKKALSCALTSAVIMQNVLMGIPFASFFNLGPVAAMAEDGDPELKVSGDYNYEIFSKSYWDGEIEEWIDVDVARIVRYNGSDTEVEIPSELDGYSVAYIIGFAFINCDKITSVTIPDSVGYIESFAFDGCTSLSVIDIPNSVDIIDNYAVGYSEVYDPDLGENVAVKNETPLTIKGLKYSEAYYYAKNNAFSFEATGELDKFTFEENIEWDYSSGDEVEITVLRLTGYIGDDSVVEIPSEVNGKSVTSVWSGAIESNPYVEEIIIPESVDSLSDLAFCSCENLKKVTVLNAKTYLCENSIGYKSVYNPDTDSYDYVVDEDITIVAAKYSNAYWYAKDNNLKFEADGDADKFSYRICEGHEFDDEGNDHISHFVVIDEYFWDEEKVEIPSEIEGYPVTEINSLAVYGDRGTNSVYVPETVGIIYGEALGYSNNYYHDEEKDEWYRAKNENFIIKGYTYSEAYLYAMKNGFKFESVGELPVYDYSVTTDYSSEGEEITGVRIDKYRGIDAEVVIPSEIDGYPVIGIGDSCFEDNDFLTSVVIPEGVLYINTYAFADCDNLESVKFPNSLRLISNSAFRSSMKLDGVVIPENVRCIGEYAFCDCPVLITVEIQSSDCDIFEYGLGYITFWDEEALCDTYIPVGGFTIKGYRYSNVDEYATENSFAFESIGELPAYNYRVGEVNGDIVVFITKYNHCDEEVVIPSEIEDYPVYCINSDAFYNNTTIKSVVIPEGVMTIESYAFEGCINLENVELPNSLESVVCGAFYNCSSLTSITLPEKELYYDRPFAYTGITEITIPSCVGYLNDYSFGYDYEYVYNEETDTNEIVYTKIDGFVIKGYTNSSAHRYAMENGFDFVSIGELKPYTIIETKENIPNEDGIITEYKIATITKAALMYEEVTIPSEIDGNIVKYIEWGSFRSNPMVKSIVIPDTVEYIGDYAFEYMENLQQVVIPASVLTIGYRAFGYCGDEKVEGLTIKGYTNSAAYRYAMDNGFDFVSMGEVEPFTYENIYGWRFDDDGNAVSATPLSIVAVTNYYGDGADIVVPETIDGKYVYSIYSGNYTENRAFTSITIPDGVCYIVDGSIGVVSDVEGNYTAIEGFTIYGYTYSAAETYANQYGINFVSLGEGNPFDYSFTDELCSGIEIVSVKGEHEQLIIPDTILGIDVVRIGDNAFNGCTASRLYIPASITDIALNAFEDMSELIVIEVDEKSDYFCEVDGVLYSKDMSTLILATKNIGLSFVVPDSVTEIKPYAFNNCSFLYDVTLPDSLTGIGNYAFLSTGLSNIVVPDNVCIGEQAVGYNSDGAVDGFVIVCNPETDARAYAEDNNIAYADMDILDAEVSGQAYVQKEGWLDVTAEGDLIGTVGKGLRLEAIKITLPESLSEYGSIRYRAHVQNYGWMDWACDGAIAGTEGENKRLEAIEIELTDELASVFDVYYRVHAQNVGWTDWAVNGESCGTAGFSYRVEAVEIKLVRKGLDAPGATDNTFIENTSGVGYAVNVQSIGWMNPADNGATAGTIGKGLRMECLEMSLLNQVFDGSIEYRSHIQNIGWESTWAKDGEFSGTIGRNLRLEAIQIRLTGEMAIRYDIYYRVHAQNIGWTGWAKNGESCGTSGFGYRVEGIEVKLVLKGHGAPGSTDNKFVNNTSGVSYSASVQNIGWMDAVKNGATAGTTGRGLRMEALKINLVNPVFDGGIEYRSHIQNIGWESEWASNGTLSGTTGRALRLEAIQLRLTGMMAVRYDIYYRVHAQNVGWTGWAKNGESCGTSGFGYRVESIEIRLVLKGYGAPGSTDKAFISK
ncbi:MAG: leucine-rich repeat protein [Lachnospiraceae bacterium]|nr:leucine-rich repeat protein [Lachnospiraceae bacterium]